MRYLLVSVLLLAGLSAVAQEQRDTPPLPEPLSLEQALAMSQETHPLIMQAEAARDLARATLEASDAQNGLNVFMEGRVRWIEPPATSPDQSHDDHKLSLYARKNLYDFGRTTARHRSAQADLRSRELGYLDIHTQRHIMIMQRYFDVLLADLEFARDDEAMAVAYVTLDKMRQRHELGQVSDIELMQQEASYQQTRLHRSRSEALQRSTREVLAIALNRPGQPVSHLLTPNLDDAIRPVPEYGELLEKAQRDNPHLRALRERVVAGQERLAAARAGGRPTLIGEAEASAYSRELGSNDPFRVGVVLTVPLYTAGAVNAAVGQEQARLYQAQAELRSGEDEVRQSVLLLWQELELLRIQQEEVKAQMEFRDLYLDRSRTYYEMEVNTDLGDAMVRLTEVQLEQARVLFQTALAWERLRGLTGETAAGVQP
ncbi:MAG TPA: TolC family protein [Gammaproteobacteria bacterium]